MIRPNIIKEYIARVPISLPPYPEVLEIGCGTGAVSFALLERFPNAHVVATDTNPKALLTAAKIAFKKQIPPERLEFGESDANNPQEIIFLDREIPAETKPNSFHCVIANRVLEHTDMELSLPVIFRILKPGGYFLSINTHDTFCGKIYGSLSGFSPIPTNTFINMLNINGFENIETIPFSWNEFPTNIFQTGTIATKKKV